MAYTLNRRLAELIDSNGQLATGKIATGYISTAHFASNSITDAKLHSSFALPASALSSRDTGDLSEGSNQYFTNARVQTYISGNRSYGGITASGTHTFTANDVDFIVQDTTDSVTNYIWRHHGNGALYLGSQDAIVNIRSSLQINGTQVFDTSRNMSNVGTAVFNGAVTLNSSLNVASTVGIAGTTVIDSSRNLTNIGTISSGNITTSGYLRGPASFTIDPAAHGDNTGTVVIAGNLQVDGTTTTINSTTLEVDDLNITLASGSANAGAANGAGITVDIANNTNPTLLYNGTLDRWDFNKDISVSGNVEVRDGDMLRAYRGGDSAYAGLFMDTGEKLYIRNSWANKDIVMLRTGEVGIGTNSPAFDLDVLDTSTASNTGAGVNIAHATQPQLRFTQTTGNYRMYLGIRTNDLIIANDSGAEKVRFEQNGNVGIGTSAPMSHLHVNKDTSGHNTDGITIGKVEVNGWIDTNEEMGRLSWAASYGTGSSFAPAIGAYISAKADANWNLNEAPTRIGLFTAPENSLTPVERMRISKDGNVIIGNSTYGSSLGQLRVINDAASAPASLSLFGYNNISDDAEFAKIDFASQISGTGGNPTAKISAKIEGTNERAAHLTFHTHNDGGSLQERMRIASDGNVGIGETSPLGTLHVRTTDSGATADASADDLIVENNSNTGISILSGTSSTGSIYFGDSGTNWDGYIAYTHGSGATHRKFVIGTAAGGNSLSIDAIGHVGIAKSTPIAWSSGYKSLQVGGRGFVGAHSGSDLYVGQNAYYNSGWKYEDSVAASLTQHSGGQITHFVTSAGTAGNAITWTRALHIKTNGYVGFGGSSNPSFPVEINATAGADGLQLVGRSADNISSIAFSNNAKSVSSYIQSDSSWMRVRADGGFHFKRGGTPSTSSSNAFTITDANLIVTADSYLNGDLKVGTDSSNPGAIYITDNSTTAYTLGIIGTGTRQFEFRGSSSGADYNTSFTNPSSGGHNLTVNGNFTAVSTSNSAILINGNSGGLSFTGGNNRIYFNSARALEGDGTTLQVGEGHTTGLYQMATNTFYGNINPASDDTYDLGNGSARWRNVYTGDLHLSNEGKEEGNEVDGTTGNWTIQEGEEHLYIINNKSGKKFRFALEEIE